MGILTEDVVCNLRGDIVILSLFAIVIFVYSGLIPSKSGEQELEQSKGKSRS